MVRTECEELVIDCLKVDIELNCIKLTEIKAVSLQSGQLIVYLTTAVLIYPVSCGYSLGIVNLLIVTTDGEVYVVYINIPLIVVFMLYT
jgi:hypothetical protein